MSPSRKSSAGRNSLAMRRRRNQPGSVMCRRRQNRPSGVHGATQRTVGAACGFGLCPSPSRSVRGTSKPCRQVRRVSQRRWHRGDEPSEGQRARRAAHQQQAAIAAARADRQTNQEPPQGRCRGQRSRHQNRARGAGCSAGPGVKEGEHAGILCAGQRRKKPVGHGHARCWLA